MWAVSHFLCRFGLGDGPTPPGSKSRPGHAGLELSSLWPNMAIRPEGLGLCSRPALKRFYFLFFKNI